LRHSLHDLPHQRLTNMSVEVELSPASSVAAPVNHPATLGEWEGLSDELLRPAIDALTQASFASLCRLLHEAGFMPVPCELAFDKITVADDFGNVLLNNVSGIVCPGSNNADD
jgi:hypothetical protein